MVNLVLSGITPSYLSTYCGDSKNTITLWVKIADERGFEALKVKRQTGRPPKLDSTQITQIRLALEVIVKVGKNASVYDFSDMVYDKTLQSRSTACLTLNGM